MHMYYSSWDKSRPSVSHGSLWPHCHSSVLLWAAPHPPEGPGAPYHPFDQKSLLSIGTAGAGRTPAALQCHFIPSKMEDLTGMLHHCWTGKSHPQTSQKLHEKYNWWEFVIGKTASKGQPRSLVWVLLAVSVSSGRRLGCLTVTLFRSLQRKSAHHQMTWTTHCQSQVENPSKWEKHSQSYSGLFLEGSFWLHSFHT